MTSRTKHNIGWCISLTIIGLLVGFLIFQATACTSFTPPPKADGGPIPPAVTTYYLDRGGYITALWIGVAGRLSGKLSDKNARDLETWRGLYAMTVLGPVGLQAHASIEPGEWDRLAAEQSAAETQWRSLLPAPVPGG